VEAGQDCIK